MEKLQDWVTVQEASKLTGYNPEQIRRLARERKIESQKWGNAWMINHPSLLNYIETVGHGPKPKTKVNIDGIIKT